MINFNDCIILCDNDIRIINSEGKQVITFCSNLANIYAEVISDNYLMISSLHTSELFDKSRNIVNSNGVSIFKKRFSKIIGNIREVFKEEYKQDPFLRFELITAFATSDKNILLCLINVVMDEYSSDSVKKCVFCKFILNDEMLLEKVERVPVPYDEADLNIAINRCAVHGNVRYNSSSDILYVLLNDCFYAIGNVINDAKLIYKKPIPGIERLTISYLSSSENVILKSLFYSYYSIAINILGNINPMCLAADKLPRQSNITYASNNMCIFEKGAHSVVKVIKNKNEDPILYTSPCIKKRKDLIISDKLQDSDLVFIIDPNKRIIYDKDDSKIQVLDKKSLNIISSRFIFKDILMYHPKLSEAKIFSSDGFANGMGLILIDGFYNNLDSVRSVKIHIIVDKYLNPISVINDCSAFYGFVNENENCNGVSYFYSKEQNPFLLYFYNVKGKKLFTMDLSQVAKTEEEKIEKSKEKSYAFRTHLLSRFKLIGNVLALELSISYSESYINGVIHYIILCDLNNKTVLRVYKGSFFA